jgi:hypothetical protein
VEFFRLKVKNKFLYLLVIGKVVQGNGDNFIKWYKCQEVVEVIVDVTCSYIRKIIRLQ